MHSGGQAFTIKLRKTLERSPTAMLVDPPYDINRTRSEGSTHTPWRQMKCVLHILFNFRCELTLMHIDTLVVRVVDCIGLHILLLTWLFNRREPE
jgi:hypothetical protein